MSNLYIFSGLGADESVFQHLDFTGYNITFIQWLIPNKNETIEAYASRLLEQIKTKRPILIGLSFGGMMAIEVAKRIETEKIILISSVKTNNELPFYFKVTGFLGLHRLLPLNLLKKANIFTYWLFGANTTSDKRLLKQILVNTNTEFLKWSIDKIANWKNKKIISNTVHLHGTNDKILPMGFVNCDIKIYGGGHLMVLDKALEISLILRRELVAGR